MCKRCLTSVSRTVSVMVALPLLLLASLGFPWGGASRVVKAEGNVPTGLQDYERWFGSQHAHIGMDGDDGAAGSTAASAFAYAANVPLLKYYIVAPHVHAGRQVGDTTLYSEATYDTIRSQADAATTSTFVAIAGQEVSTISSGGHWNLYNAADMVGSDHPDGDWNDANDYYEHVAGLGAAGEDVAAQFNHADTGNFGNRYDANAAPYFGTFAVSSGYTGATNKDFTNNGSNLEYGTNNPLENLWAHYLGLGWKVSPAADQDNHEATWGVSSSEYTVIVRGAGTTLSRANVLQGLRQHMTYATEDANMQIGFIANGWSMGQTIGGDANVAFTIWWNNPSETICNNNVPVCKTETANDVIRNIWIYKNSFGTTGDSVGQNAGTYVARYQPNTASGTWNVTLAANVGDWFVVRFQDTYTFATDPTYGRTTSKDLTWSAPVWYDPAHSDPQLLVGPANQPPTADPQNVSTGEDTGLGIVLTGSDPDGDQVTFSVQTGPGHGALSGTAPNLTYTPAADYNGDDSFTFVVNDGRVNSAPATVSITISAVNDPPVANAQSVTAQQETALAITLTASDVDGDPLTFSVTIGPLYGTLSGTAPDVLYTPAAGYAGPDSFTFVADDGQATSNAAVVDITVTPINHAPVADAQSVTTDEDTPAGILLTGSDIDGDALTFSLAVQPSHGTLSGTPPQVSYTPAANYNGADSFAFVANDGQLTSEPALVAITVRAVNDAPVANAQLVTTSHETAVGITLTGSDVDGDPLTYSVAAFPAHGSLSGMAPNLTYTPAAGFSGTDSFTFVANDGMVDSAPATVSVTVTPAGDIIWLSLAANGTLGSLGTVNDEDIVALDTVTGAYAWVFDGSDVGIGGDIDAFDVLDNGHILISFDASQTVTGIGTVADPDIVEFTPTSLGSTTAGTFAWKFDASDVGLSTSNEDVDALFFLSDGTMLVSTRGSFSVTGASGTDADLIKFTATSWGSTTAGTWSWYFDASDVGLSTSNEDVDGLWVDQAVTPYPDVYLCTVGAFSVTGVSGQNEDIFVFHPTALGSTTAGSFGPGLYLDGSLFGLSAYDVDAFDVQR